MAHSTENTTQGTEVWHSLYLISKASLRLLLMAFMLIALAPRLALAQEEAPAPEPPADEAPTATVHTPPPLYLNREDRDMKLLAAKLDPDSVVWLDALEEQFLAIYEPEYTGVPQGAVLLLHGEGQHSSWPKTIQMIRSSLPRFGWNTLSMSLPNPDVVPPPPRDPRPIASTQPAPTAPENAEQGDSDTSDADAETPKAPLGGEDSEIFDAENNALSDGTLPPPSNPRGATEPPAELKIPVEDRTVARIRAAMKYLNNLGQFNIVLLGDGVGAARAGHFFSRLPVPVVTNPNAKPIKPIRAVVILNARNHNPLGDINLTNSLFDPAVPTLDIFFGLDQRNALDAEQRKRYAQRNMHKVYRQVQLPVMSEVAQQGENRVSRRIRGFLQEYARGVKVDNAIVNKY